MTDVSLDQEHIDRFNSQFNKAMELIESYLIVDGEVPRSLNFIGRSRLKRGAVLLRACLEIYPASWQSMLFLGKIYQRLGEHEKAVGWMAEALKESPENTMVAKEASIEALALGDFKVALAWLREALRSRPDDPALHSNLGLAYLLCGNATDAVEQFNIAANLEVNPSTGRLLNLAEDVASGRKQCPRTLSEIRRLL